MNKNLLYVNFNNPLINLNERVRAKKFKLYQFILKLKNNTFLADDACWGI